VWTAQLPKDSNIYKALTVSITCFSFISTELSYNTKKVEVRYDRSKRDRFIVYFNGKRMGQASPLNLHFNAHSGRKTGESA